jgi:hypothetical protein
MKKECKKYIEKALADSENRRTAFRTHCGECPECASLASDWSKMRNIAIPSAEVPLSLDFTILAAAGKAAHARSRRRVAIRRIISTEPPPRVAWHAGNNLSAVTKTRQC